MNGQRAKSQAQRTARALHRLFPAGYTRRCAGGLVLLASIMAMGHTGVIDRIQRSTGRVRVNSDSSITFRTSGADRGGFDASGNFAVSGTFNYCADAGASDTYSCSLSPAPASYVTGAHYLFKANTANTGAATLNLNTLGAATIKKVAGGITTDLADNDIRAGQLVEVVYDGTNMQMQSTLGNAAGGGGLGGSTGATDNALLRADGTGGATVQSSAITVNDTGDLSTPTGSIFAGGSATGDSSTSPGVFLGFNTTARILLNNGTAAQNRGIDQSAGTLRFFNAQNGDLWLSMNGTTFAVGNNQTLTAANATLVTSIISPLFRSDSAKVLLRGTGTGATQISATQTTAPTCSTNCGTGSPTVTGTDSFMTVQMGSTGSPASGWVVTFNGTWAAAPSCIVQMGKAGMVVGKQALTVVTTTTNLTVETNGTAPATDDIYHIHCGGTQ